MKQDARYKGGRIDGQDLWIFAYGSLMWRPDFPFEERQRARLFGFHRALCIYSHHYRGTPARPGLVLGLDRGGSCVGVCFRIVSEAAAATLSAVRDRELVSDVYVEISASVRLDDGRRPTAICYVARPDHPQYAGTLAADELFRLVRQGSGVSGPNLDYVRNTHRHLLDIGIVDPTLAWLSAGEGSGEQLGGSFKSRLEGRREAGRDRSPRARDRSP